MPKQVEAPIYWRNGRAYLDARAYAEVGGAQERLVPPGEKLATKDPIVARQLATRRIQELEELRRRKTMHGVTRGKTADLPVCVTIPVRSSKTASTMRPHHQMFVR